MNSVERFSFLAKRLRVARSRIHVLALFLLGVVACDFAVVQPAGAFDPKHSLTLIQAGAPASEARLRKAIADLQKGQPSLNEMEPTLQIAVQQQLTNVVNRLQMLGPLQKVEFVGHQNMHDVYRVTFQNGVTAWMIQISPNDKISGLWFN